MVLAATRPNAGATNKTTPDGHKTDKHALSHDTKLANRLLLQLSDLAATRLIHILAHRQAEIIKLKPEDPPPFTLLRRGIDPPPDLIP